MVKGLCDDLPMVTPLARLLVARRITQQQLAKAVHCGQASISRIVNGRTGADLAIVARIVDYLDPERAEFNELHLLYPQRFEDWRPAGAAPQQTAAETP